MNSDKPIIWGAAAAVIALAGILFWYGYKSHHPAQPVVASVPVALSQPEPTPASAPPAIEHPVPEVVDSAPLPPSVDHSDEALIKAISGLPDSEVILKQIATENIIRRVVSTVDNLPRKKLPQNLRLFQAVPGQFKTSTSAGQLTLSADNYGRYRPFVEMVQGVDAQKTVAIYFRYYRLFQKAFDDLGYADGYFNDHLVSAIDHLLASPEPATPPALVQPNVLYQYADPGLEGLSAGQKALIRMGPANEAVVKGKLREFKAELLAHEHH